MGAAVAVAALASCSGRLEDQPVTPTRLMTGNALPLIDRDLPERLETATFAVG